MHGFGAEVHAVCMTSLSLSAFPYSKEDSAAQNPEVSKQLLQRRPGSADPVVSRLFQFIMQGCENIKFWES